MARLRVATNNPTHASQSKPQYAVDSPPTIEVWGFAGGRSGSRVCHPSLAAASPHRNADPSGSRKLGGSDAPRHLHNDHSTTYGEPAIGRAKHEEKLRVWIKDADSRKETLRSTCRAIGSREGARLLANLRVMCRATHTVVYKSYPSPTSLFSRPQQPRTHQHHRHNVLPTRSHRPRSTP